MFFIKNIFSGCNSLLIIPDVCKMNIILIQGISEDLSESFISFENNLLKSSSFLSEESINAIDEKYEENEEEEKDIEESFEKLLMRFYDDFYNW